MYHKILLRQLLRQFGAEDRIPGQLHSLFQSISSVYQHADEDRRLIERSLEISSREFGDLNLQLQKQHGLIEREVVKRTQELSIERNKLSLTLASITDAVITVDLDNRIVVFNKSAEKLLDISSQEVLGRNIDEIIDVHENNMEIPTQRYVPSHDDSLEGVVFTGNALKVVCKDREVYVNLVSSHITDDRQVKMGYIISMHDVSEERRLEEMKIDFVSMAAHELRTPLTVIRGYASMLQDETAKQLSDEQREYMNRMIISINNLENLINNLLNVSRIERSLLKLDMAVSDLENIIKEALDTLNNSAKTKNQNLRFVKEQEHFPEVTVDHLRIEEVLINLIGNAITYTRPGGDITVTLSQKDNNLIVSIIDTGTGIPQEALGKLFTKFFRVSGPLEQGSKGTGLGLYISKSIIELHLGTIGVESEFGRGSRFYFTLPIATEAAKAEMKSSLPKTEGFGIIMNTERQRRHFNKGEAA